MKKAFTLAEVMVALSIIGVITAVIIPIAFQVQPDENIMKFKKGNSTLYQAISTLIQSEKYYNKGDLGTKKTDTDEGELLDGSTQDHKEYFCETFADMLSVRESKCGGSSFASNSALATDATVLTSTMELPKNVSETELTTIKTALDNACKIAPREVDYIITTDDINYYQVDNSLTFGTKINDNRLFAPPGAESIHVRNQFGHDAAYKVFCMDIDGIPNNATTSNCVNECPFGYGIRADGKILNGARADEWIAKDIKAEE